MTRALRALAVLAAACGPCDDAEQAQSPPRREEPVPAARALAVVDAPELTPAGAPSRPLADLRWPPPIEVIAFAPDGGAIAAGTVQGLFVAADEVRVFARETWIAAVSWSADGTAVRGTDGWYGGHAITSYDATSGEASDFTLPFGERRPYDVAWTADASAFVAYDHDGIYASSGDHMVQATEAHAGRVAAVAVAPTVAASTDSREIWLWQLPSLAKRAAVPWEQQVTALVFSRDGSRLAAASDAGEVLVVDVAGGAAVAALRHPARVATVAFSPDGTKLATACDDFGARIWSLAPSGPTLERTLAHPASVQAVAFSPDGATVATGADDGRLRTFESATGAARSDRPLAITR